MTTLEQQMLDLAQRAKRTARLLRALPTASKNAILHETAEALLAQKAAIQAKNAEDVAAARQSGLSEAMVNRLQLSDAVLAEMVQGLHEVAAMADPVGAISDLNRRPSGIQVGRMRVPLGVILMIYESRPNVTLDAAALCLKAGNAVILRGGSEALASNQALAAILHQVLTQHGLDPDCVQVVPTTDREAIDLLLQQEECIDLVIPRGGESLIRRVTAQSRIPVLKHYRGVCHAFVDASADLDMACRVIASAKIQRPSACNALECLLVHEQMAPRLLPRLTSELTAHGVRLLGCAQAQALAPQIEPAQDSDWGREFLDLILAVRVVSDFDQALAHIERYGSRHTEAILTADYAQAQRFLQEVDASAVMVNASTRFNDGGQFGLGLEIGISTSKLHAYGPMGLQELTTQKFVVLGSGEVRK